MIRYTMICVVLVCSLTVTLSQANDLSPYGINFQAPSGSEMINRLDEAQAIGIDWIRVPVSWKDVESTKGNYDWSLYDSISAAADARGINIFATLYDTPAWATTGSAGSGVPNSSDWTDFVNASVSRYAGTIENWGLWNEPNNGPSRWEGTRQQFIDVILKDGADAIHAANPSAKAIGPETSGSNEWYYWLRDSLLQAGDKLDIVSQHYYGGGDYALVTSRLEETTTYGNDPSNWNLEEPSIREVLDNVGWTKPFWLTETGWESGVVGESAQAANYTGLLTDWYTGLPNRDWVDKVFPYELKDGGANTFGIIGSAGQRKDAYFAYQNFIGNSPTPGVITVAPGDVSLDQDPSGFDFRWQYSTTNDAYYQNGDFGTVKVSGWQNAVALQSRAERGTDASPAAWLARDANGGGPPTVFEWAFDFSGSGYVIDELKVLHAGVIYSDGITGNAINKIEWEISTDDGASWTEYFELLGSDIIGPGNVIDTALHDLTSLVPAGTDAYRLRATMTYNWSKTKVQIFRNDAWFSQNVGEYLFDNQVWLIPAPTTPGDFDQDGDVDGTDFLEWQRGFGTVYDATDLANWENNFGSTGAGIAAAATVPEPSSVVLFSLAGLMGLAVVASRRYTRGHAHEDS